MFMTTAAIALAVAAQDAAPRVTISPSGYREAKRCEALVEAAARLSPADAPDDALYDAGLYWSLAAARAAELAGLDPARVAADQERERAEASARLSGEDPEARATLARCRAATPDMG
ncbi:MULTISPECIES: hypothetical protein [unclassified Brevundimonas]|uniref:hypothetical protein n=1 Tax=unclassified Brevundimonas TaxID=2622653 RepID=UPI0010760F09|nr:MULTISPECIES: hypothetical protein [unclassified Brevundimonas]QBX38506.1 hypothetical protein E4M01_12525 [Brevundimonas sp. MF30-B]